MYAFVAFVVIMILVCMTRKAKEMYKGSYSVRKGMRRTGKPIIEKDGKFAHTVENISECEEICNTDENCVGFNSWRNGTRCAFQGPGSGKKYNTWGSWHEKQERGYGDSGTPANTVSIQKLPPHLAPTITYTGETIPGPTKSTAQPAPEVTKNCEELIYFRSNNMYGTDAKFTTDKSYNRVLGFTDLGTAKSNCDYYKGCSGVQKVDEKNTHRLFKLPKGCTLNDIKDKSTIVYEKQ